MSQDTLIRSIKPSINTKLKYQMKIFCPLSSTLKYIRLHWASTVNRMPSYRIPRFAFGAKGDLVFDLKMTSIKI